MWLVHRAAKWQMRRRVHTLEANLRNVQATQAQSMAEAEQARLEQDRLARERPSGIAAPPPIQAPL